MFQFLFVVTIPVSATSSSKDSFSFFSLLLKMYQTTLSASSCFSFFSLLHLIGKRIRIGIYRFSFFSLLLRKSPFSVVVISVLVSFRCYTETEDGLITDVEFQFLFVVTGKEQASKLYIQFQFLFVVTAVLVMQQVMFYSVLVSFRCY